MKQINRLLDIIKNGRPEDKLYAADALGEIGDARAFETLITSLSDENLEVRRSAAYTLGKIGEPAVEPLLALLSDEYPEVRRSAADALAIIRKR